VRGGRGEVKVVSVETHGQPDAGWLAATVRTEGKLIKPK